MLQLEDAIASYNTAIMIKPDFIGANWNKSLALLLTGDFENGWKLFEWRWQLEENQEIAKKHQLKTPLWSGTEPLIGKTILLYVEQGLGDIIQFCRYVPLVADLGAEVILEAPSSMGALLNNLEGELSVQIFGSEIIHLMKDCYQEGETIEKATFKLVNHLFESFGLVVLLPDSTEVKAAFIPVMQKELLEFFSQKEVQQTVANFPVEYKIQASGRELNLFYLLDGQRERIEYNNGVWTVLNTELKFSKEQIIEELNQHPERFSPNVILRPVLQELILPNIAFVGGGGEIAYWLQLKRVFEKVTVSYPVLVIRNSFLFIPKEIQHLINQLHLIQGDLFKKETELINQLVISGSKLQLDLKDEQLELAFFYKKIKSIAESIDITLSNHVTSLELQAAKKISVLEKKMLRAEKKKFEAQQRQLHKIKSQLFPNDNLQERMDNLLVYYAKWGKQFIEIVYKNSPGLEQQFVILTEA
jgi:bacillithiol biosynthesis cysteine-adding enzyme BshC